ncbi:hypothetical protein BJX65DRAFT_273057 [Aspergillus insuetus]
MQTPLPGALVRAIQWARESLYARQVYLAMGFLSCRGVLHGKRDWRAVREVVNPRMENKVQEVAARHGIERRVSLKACRRLLWGLPVLP